MFVYCSCRDGHIFHIFKEVMNAAAKGPFQDGLQCGAVAELPYHPAQLYKRFFQSEHNTIITYLTTTVSLLLNFQGFVSNNIIQ